MLENLRRKSLVRSYHSEMMPISFSRGYATYKSKFVINRQKLKLSKAKSKTFSKSSFEFPYDNPLLVSTSYQGVEFNMIACPSGNFTMGSKYVGMKPTKKRVNSPFLLGETEITQELYEKVMGINPSKFQASSVRERNRRRYPFSSQHPVEQVSWEDAILFCNKLSSLQGLDLCYTKDENGANNQWICDFTKNGYRLPTEMEWEYAAKAGTDNQWSGTDNALDIEFYTNSLEDKDLGSTHQVKTKKPNEWGFYDMTGNVYEWCDDQFQPGNKIFVDYRVSRGGSWSPVKGLQEKMLNNSNTNYGKAENRSDHIGFRICRSIVD